MSSLRVQGFDRAIETLGRDLGFIESCFEKIILSICIFGCAGSLLPMGYYLAAASRGYSCCGVWGAHSSGFFGNRHGLWGAWASLVAASGFQ